LEKPLKKKDGFKGIDVKNAAVRFWVKRWNEKMSDNRGLQIIIAFFFVLFIGLYIGMDIQQRVDKSSSVQSDQIIFIPYPEPLQPVQNHTIVVNVSLPELFIITTNTPCSEPYYIDPTDSEFEIGEYVKSTSEYKRLLNNQFCGKIIDIDGDLLIVCIGGDTKRINKYWVEPWDCETIRYDETLGYYCHIELIYGMFSYNESSPRVNIICK